MTKAKSPAGLRVRRKRDGVAGACAVFISSTGRVGRTPQWVLDAPGRWLASKDAGCGRLGQGEKGVQAVGKEREKRPAELSWPAWALVLLTSPFMASRKSIPARSWRVAGAGWVAWIGAATMLPGPGLAAGYQDNAELARELKELARSHPQDVRLTNVCSSLQSNAVWVLELGRGTDEERAR